MLLTFHMSGFMFIRMNESDPKVGRMKTDDFWLDFKLLSRAHLFANVLKAYGSSESDYPNGRFTVPLHEDMPVWGGGPSKDEGGHIFFPKGNGRMAIPHGGNAILRDSTTPHIFEAEQVALVNPLGERVGDFAANEISAGKGFDPDVKARLGMFVAGHTLLLRNDESNLPGDTEISLKITGSPGMSGKKTVAQYARDPGVLVPELYGIFGGQIGFPNGFALSLGAAVKNVPDTDHTPQPGDTVEISISRLPTLSHGVVMAG